MTGLTLFFIIVGAAFLTAQLFRLIDFIERPTRQGRGILARQHALPAAWNIFLWNALGKVRWMFWKN